ncbi:MAG: hypothetical protein ACPLZC_04865 [Candidatus Bathyarchaeales archaeon]
MPFFAGQLKDPIETTLAFTGVLMLIGILIVSLSNKKPEIVTTTIVGITLAADLGLYLFVTPLSYSFIFSFVSISLSTLVILIIAYRLNRNAKLKPYKNQQLLGFFILLLILLPLQSQWQVAKASVIWGHKDITSKNNKFMVTVYI